MKITQCTFLFLLITIHAFCQPALLRLPDGWGDIAIPIGRTKASFASFPVRQVNNLVEFNWPQEITIGNTYNDLQSLSSSPAGRLAIYNDRTLGAVWCFMQDTVAFSDQGTGYSYFDGSVWTPAPTSRIENISTRNPVIAPLSIGEIVVSEKVPPGPIHICKRNQKGTGAWITSELNMPAGSAGLVSPGMVTSGLGKNTVHILSLTLPASQGGAPYQGQDGALIYHRSQDGGQNWDIPGIVISGTDSSQYNGFESGTFALAEPQGDKMAFVVGDPWSDLFVMKSEDGGDTWQKTVLWEHPVPFWNGQATDSIYCPDGSVHLAFDHLGKLHVVFGITRLYCDGSEVFRFPYVGGIGHWKEGVPTWTSGDLYNSLNPDSLESQGRLAISYLLDWNGNGNLDIIGNFGDYDIGPASFPQIAFDSYGVGMLVMSCITEAFDNGIQDYRHIWYKYLYMGELGDIAFDWNNQPEHLDHEAVFPSIGVRSPDNLGWPFIYMIDGEPGMAIQGDMDPFTNNLINKVDLRYMLPVIFLTVNLYVEPEEGGTVSGGGSYANGSMVTIKAAPNPGWEFVNWTSQNVLFSNYPSVTFQAIWNYSLVAHFRLISRMNEEMKGKIKVYPNPATDYINVRLPEEPGQYPVFIQLFNLTGVTVYETECSTSDEVRISTGVLPRGVYSMRIRNKCGRSVFAKIILVGVN